MKATGIVRRIDDLGRVVIPKEIRRQMRIKEGDPLEIFIENDGMVCFKRYSPFEEHDFVKAKHIIKAIFPALNFALYDDLGEKQTSTKAGFSSLFEDEEFAIKNSECDLVGYINIEGDIFARDTQTILRVLKEHFSNEN